VYAHISICVCIRFIVSSPSVVKEGHEYRCRFRLTLLQLTLVRLSLPDKDSKGNVISDSELEEKEYLRTGDKKLAVAKTKNNEKNEE
jgi:hypothetical protein